MTKLIIIRHGESLGNKVNSFLGHTDLDLSDKGKLQAQYVAKFLKDVHIDKIYSSDLLRAYNTIKPTADEKNMQIITSKNLREIYAGEWENKKFDQLCTNPKYKDAYKIWRTDIGNAECTGGESVKNLCIRICNEVEKIARENAGKTILIATHATPIRCMITKWSNTPIELMKNIPWVKNASLTYAEYNNGIFTVTSADNTNHLGDLVTQLPKNV